MSNVEQPTRHFLQSLKRLKKQINIKDKTIKVVVIHGFISDSSLVQINE